MNALHVKIDGATDHPSELEATHEVTVELRLPSGESAKVAVMARGYTIIVAPLVGGAWTSEVRGVPVMTVEAGS